jgi:SPP1 gp7 family putative phage head morphogenesis protein
VLLDKATGEVTGKPLNAYRLRTIYQTNMQTSYMVGRYQSFMANADDRPFWEYVAVMDSKTRQSHRAMHGRIFRYDDPFWDSFYPPNGFNCRCRVRARSREDIDTLQLYPSDSSGKLVSVEKEVSKRSGRKERVTGYRDPFTRKTFTPDVGWSYNPGKANQAHLDAMLASKKQDMGIKE